VKNKYPKISIVTPSYNQGQFIEDTIQSVLNQNYPNFEHIIIDNCSTDKTIEILKRYPHLDWISEPDRGQSHGLNKGFHRARGEWILWLNADDYYLLGVFERIARAYADHPEFDVIYGEAMFVDKAENQIRIKRDHAFDYKILLYYGCYIASTATSFRRRIFDDGVFLDPSYKVTMDYEYFVRLASMGYRFGFVPAPLAAFRWHDSNISSRFATRRRYERLTVQRQYGGLKWMKSDALRVKCFDGLARFYQGKRVVRRFIEKLICARRKLVL